MYAQFRWPRVLTIRDKCIPHLIQKENSSHQFFSNDFVQVVYESLTAFQHSFGYPVVLPHLRVCIDKSEY